MPRCPRAHGGIPRVPVRLRSGEALAPHKRGYSRYGPLIRVADALSPYPQGYSVADASPAFGHAAIPVYAGVFRHQYRPVGHLQRCPRVCGAIPERGGTHTEARQLSPRVRGYSDIRHQRTAETEVVPVHAGYSDEDFAKTAERRVVPVHAGVFQGPCQDKGGSARCPRARGGIPSSGASSTNCKLLSPCTRGYSCFAVSAAIKLAFVPVQAGVFPSLQKAVASSPHCPRAHGGIPYRSLPRVLSLEKSPCMRGYSVERREGSTARHVVPVQAGVFLSRRKRPAIRNSRPRTSGGIPISHRTRTNLPA